MKYLSKYNEALSKLSIEEYSSDLIKSVSLLTTENEMGLHIYKFEVLGANDEKEKLVFDETIFRNSPLRKVRVYYPSSGSYLMDINSLSEWREVFKTIEGRMNNRTEHMKRMDSVSKMFDNVTKEIIAEYFADLIDISLSSQISEVEDFNKPLYWNIYLGITYNISDGGNILINDKMREIFDMIITDTKRMETEFGVLTAVRFSTMPTVKTPVIKISIFAKDSNGEPIGYKIS